MITMITKDNSDSNFLAKTCITNRLGNATPEVLSRIVSWKDKETSYFEVEQDNLYEGKENYIRLSGANNIGENNIDSILYKMSSLKGRLGEIVDINQGVVSGCDYVSGRNINKLKDTSQIEMNDGIFVFDLNNTRDVSAISSFNDEEKDYSDHFLKTLKLEHIIVVLRKKGSCYT